MNGFPMLGPGPYPGASNFFRFSSLLAIVWLLLAGPGSSLAADLVPESLDDFLVVQEQLQGILDGALTATVGVQIGSTRGSGVIVSEEGYVLTAGHVVGRPGQDATFFFADGTQASGKTLGVYRVADAGLMKIEDEGPWPTVGKGRSADVAVGDWCVAVGHPFGYQSDRPPVVRFGRILRSTDTVLQTDCALVSGDSGGPLFDLAGRVIGVNSRIGDAATLNFHVPVDLFVTHWDRLAAGEIWEHVVRGRDHADVRGLFRPAVESVADAVLRIESDGEESALGTVVAADGWILTKASELTGEITCHLADGRELEARIVGVDEQYDLAMLKIEAADLPAVVFGEADPAVGELVVAAGPDADPLAVGVISVPRRPIPPPRGMLGVSLRNVDGAVVVESVMDDSAAQRAGIQANDRVTHVNGERVTDSEEMASLIGALRVGDRVRLAIERDAEAIDIETRLGRVESNAGDRRQRQNYSAGGVSDRRDSFPMVLQHDMVLRPADCGGPLLTLDGSVVGINIARGGRTETYSVPSDAILPLLDELKSGAAAPHEEPPEDTAEAAEETAPDGAETSAEVDTPEAAAPARGPLREADEPPMEDAPAVEPEAGEERPSSRRGRGRARPRRAASPLVAGSG